jgi:hypothetical protein
MQIEAVLLITVLVCVSLLRHEIPAIHFMHHDHMASAGSNAGHIHGTSAPVMEVSGPKIRLKTVPAEIRAGTPVKMTVSIEDKVGNPLTGLIMHHERILHVVIIGQDLKTFAHIHPEDLGPISKTMLDQSVFPLRYTFPKSGKYLIGFDFATEDNQFSDFVLLKAKGGPSMIRPEIDLSRLKIFGAYRVSLASSVPIKAGEETALTWHIEQDGKPVTDLQSYLGAPMHISVVSENLQHFMHVHGMLPGDTHTDLDHDHAALQATFGPDIKSTVSFPSKGTYALFGQVSHEGKVLLFEFMLEVR